MKRVLLSNNIYIYIYICLFFGLFLTSPISVFAQTCTSFSDDFSGSEINNLNWGLWTDNGGTAVFTTPAGEATLNLPASLDGASKGVSLDGTVRTISGGDFIAEATLKSISVGTSVSTSSLTFADNIDSTRFIEINRRSDNGILYAVVDNVQGITGSTEVVKDVGISQSSPVKVKIERIGNTIKMYYDVLDGNGYVLLRQYDNFYAGSSRFYLGLFTFGPDFPQASASFDNFSLTCLATPTSAPSSSNNTVLTYNNNQTPSCNDSKPSSAPDIFQIDGTSTSAKLFFTSVNNISDYYISYSTKPNAEEHGAQVTLGGSGGVQNFTVNLLKPNTTYYFKVRGQNGCMPGDWSSIVKMETKGDSSFYANSPNRITLPVTGNSLPTYSVIILGIFLIIGSFFFLV